ncbi:RNA polymerase sigma-70 factor [Muricauda sp. 334s03]|uniref:RNA polymerase sigma-70 factor n=1 Tax=Flagellimonas yonaguniensis TaxID=3031325 RepID=A0ABT5Y159_9FLAO|nr:RNA polymerase sigma-70 factor [[Muricauda] yonaguniensis]MDF0717130.1 RNA polymerase sigma-70 factor [[Muricauda] yonaguniensis]
MMENPKLIFKALQNRQEKALEKIFALYWKRLYIYAHSLTGDHQIAQDLVQEIFISLWEKSATTQIDQIEAYLFRGVKYRAINFLKQQQRKVSAEDTLKSRPVSEGVKEHMDYLESEELFLKTMDRLPDRCRRVFYLSRVQGYNNKEIAQEMDISIRTVETHISNALRLFRFYFKTV